MDRKLNWVEQEEFEDRDDYGLYEYQPNDDGVFEPPEFGSPESAAVHVVDGADVSVCGTCAHFCARNNMCKMPIKGLNGSTSMDTPVTIEMAACECHESGL